MDQNVSDLEYLRKHIGSGESDYVLLGWLSKDEIAIVRLAEIIRAEATDQSELDMLAKLADPAGVRVMILRGTINVGTMIEDERRNAAEQARREAAEYAASVAARKMPDLSKDFETLRRHIRPSNTEASAALDRIEKAINGQA